MKLAHNVTTVIPSGRSFWACCVSIPTSSSPQLLFCFPAYILQGEPTSSFTSQEILLMSLIRKSHSPCATISVACLLTSTGPPFSVKPSIKKTAAASGLVFFSQIVHRVAVVRRRSTLSALHI
ncbi:hypothetical protein GOP47_0007474 [Adiantum capillus-veneris]|uniref:Uncharacterized protein n=1 Tax=Adiantum capillus-veneris TaxID=13818 RepID=A0A9D4ZLZ1_ADICA|nr:hypothetical protein GOP47_0007474 [Adiantum capillus-veneris]